MYLCRRFIEEASKNERFGREEGSRPRPQRGGFLRPLDLHSKGLPTDYLWRLQQKGKLVRVGKGMYAIPGQAAFNEHQTTVEAALRVPHGVVCLISALHFHELTTQLPHEIWMAIDGKARSPKVEIIPLRIMRFSGAHLRR